MTEERGARQPRSRSLGERLFGASLEPSPPRHARPRREAPPAVRRAALVVAVEALAAAAVAVVLLYLTLTSTAQSVGRALAEVVLAGLGAAVLAAAAVGLWRVSPWSRGPVVALQLFLGLIGYTTAFEAERPLIGVPLLALAAAELYLLATPEARLAFLER
ncbi:MAG TPA: hypothetical protein VHF92_18315 [Geodermatophilus sp.]|nr:hypothetical protein [Geodermatophilus sp.]